MRQLFALLSLILLLVSCKNKEGGILPEMEVEPELLSADVMMLPPLQMWDMKSYLTFVTPGMEQSLLFFNKETKKRLGGGKLEMGRTTL